MALPLATVVVCTYNRAALLPDALESLERLSTNGRFEYEVLVVDNASTDDTPRIVREFATRRPDLFRGVRESRPGVSAARNRGVAEARGEWIAFFDDDQLADTQWLSELIALAERRRTDCVGGSVRPKLPYGCLRRPGPFVRVLLGETVGRDSEAPYTRKFAPGCGNLMVRRAVFDRVGLFDETLTTGGEDTDLFRRIRAAGIVGWYSPTALVWHCIPAERLEADSLLWSATRIGGHVARRERRERGAVGFLPLAGLRAAQWLVATGPKRWLAWFRGDLERKLDNACLTRFFAGYVAAAKESVFGATSKPASALEFRQRGAKANATATRDLPEPTAA
jgi:GT2 family glycosyltransferase